MVANLRHNVKNVPMLLRAAKRVAARQPDVHFVIAGEGELQKELIESAQHSGLAGKVHFVGRCIDVPSLVAASSVCVLTSFAEGFSNSILEYMAAGKPVVATNVGGAAEAVVEHETGFLVASDDDVALASRFIQLLDDEEMASKFGSEGRRIAGEKFSQEGQLRKTVELYNFLLR